MEVPKKILGMLRSSLGIFIQKGEDTDLRSILLRLNDKFNKRINIFGSQDEWYDDKYFVDQATEIAHLCKIRKMMSEHTALRILSEAGVHKKFSLPNALAFVEKIFDKNLLPEGKSLTVMLSDNVRVSDSSCGILVQHYSNGTWELFLYSCNIQGRFGPHCYILCK
jgi:hypothetical protein